MVQFFLPSLTRGSIAAFDFWDLETSYIPFGAPQGLADSILHSARSMATLDGASQGAGMT